MHNLRSRVEAEEEEEKRSFICEERLIMRIGAQKRRYKGIKKAACELVDGMGLMRHAIYQAGTTFLENLSECTLISLVRELASIMSR